MKRLNKCLAFFLCVMYNDNMCGQGIQTAGLPKIKIYPDTILWV